MRYYPGILLEELKENVWVVKFNDDNMDEVKKENMIPWDQLGKNDSVLVLNDNNKYLPGKIININLK